MENIKILNVTWVCDIGIVTIHNGHEVKTYMKKVSGLNEEKDIEEVISLGYRVYPSLLKQILNCYEKEELTQQIAGLEKENKVLQKTLEYACKNCYCPYDDNKPTPCDNGNIKVTQKQCNKCALDFFRSKAEKKLKGE